MLTPQSGFCLPEGEGSRAPAARPSAPDTILRSTKLRSGENMAIYQRIVPGRWSDKLTFSPAVRIGNLMFISGTTAVDENHNVVGKGDIVAQTRYIFQKFEALLRAAGASFDNIVETTDYFVSLKDYNRTAEVRREFFKGPPYPAATGVQVARLIRDEALIEIKATVFLDKSA
jgi:aminoacrylate peracid reductase